MNLPNKLTIVRLIIIPFFLILMVVPFDWGSVTFWGATIPVAELIAAILFIAATITDNLDGRIARRDHLVTNFGKFADPLADKLLVMTAFIVLTGQGVVPSWVTAIIIWRELSVTGLRLLLVEQNGTVLAAKMPGKIKTTTQFIAIIFLLLHNVILQSGIFHLVRLCCTFACSLRSTQESTTLLRVVAFLRMDLNKIG